jgi:hypothetical protein
MSMKRRDASSDGDDVSDGLPVVQMPEIPENDDSDDDVMSELRDKKKRLRTEIETLQMKVNKAEAELTKTSGFNEERWRELLVSFVSFYLILRHVCLFLGLRLGATK